MNPKPYLVLLAAALAAAACDSPAPRAAEAKEADPASAVATPAAATLPQDSALPIEEQLRRFRAGLVEPKGLENGFRSPDALARAFARAVSARDTAALSRMKLTREEFAWFYYPQSPRSLPPYELDPDLAWMQVRANGQRGYIRLMTQFAGKEMRVHGQGCEGKTESYNGIRVMSYCWIRYTGADGRTGRDILYGGIIERGGIYKLVSYANRL
jgi:hypothetical protein